MAIYEVTASITLNYNTEDGIASTLEEAIEDMKSVLQEGQIMPEEFNITATDTNGYPVEVSS